MDLILFPTGFLYGPVLFLTFGAILFELLSTGQFEYDDLQSVTYFAIGILFILSFRIHQRRRALTRYCITNKRAMTLYNGSLDRPGTVRLTPKLPIFKTPRRLQFGVSKLFDQGFSRFLASHPFARNSVFDYLNPDDAAAAYSTARAVQRGEAIEPNDGAAT
ncbi:MAG: hypothetical protein AAGJ96_07045 [Pseudomonadota bacterium]